MSYAKLDLVQGSKEWLDFRYDFITASQVPALFGLSPYQTKFQLYEEKILRREANNEGKEFIFARGHKAEEAARDYLKTNMGISFDPAVVISIGAPALLASLDGFSESTQQIFEAKLVGADTLDEIRNGKIPAHHQCQMQAALLVSEAKECIYFATDLKGGAHVATILPDKNYQSEIASAVMKFKVLNIAACVPPELSDSDFVDVIDPRFAELENLDAELKALEQKIDIVKTDLSKKFKAARVRCGGVTITRSTKKGSIVYKNIPMLKGLDLEKYRGKPSDVVTFRFKASEDK